MWRSPGRKATSQEVSESQLDQLISPEYPTVEDVAKIKKTKKSVKLTIPHHPTVEGLTESFIAWYKDHGMTMSVRKALEANRWMEQMIHEFKWAYIRKYKISQDYAMRYPDEKLSNEDELEEGGLAILVGPPREQCPKDSEKGADGSTLERTTKKKKAKKTSPPGPPGEGKKKVVKCKKGQGNEPGTVTYEPPLEKKQKGERRKKKKRKAETDAAGPIPKKKKAKGTPSATLRRAPNVELPLVLEVPPGAAPVAMDRGQAWMSSWRPICSVWTPQPQWPSQARPCPVQWCPRSQTWEVSWLDSENLFPGLEHDRCWWPLLF